MNEQKIIESLGLSKVETKAYLTLLKHGPSTLAELAHSSGVHRPALYKLLPLLVCRGLVTTSERGKRTIYHAADPEALYTIAAHTQQLLADVVPGLRAHTRTGASVRHLRGVEGIQFVFHDVVHSLPKEGVFYRYSSGRDRNKGKYNKFLPKMYIEARDRKQIERYIITSAKDDRRLRRPRLERAMRIVPERYSLFPFDLSQVIYANKVAIIDYEKESAIIIEDEILAKFQQNLFMLLFTLLGKLPENEKLL